MHDACPSALRAARPPTLPPRRSTRLSTHERTLRPWLILLTLLLVALSSGPALADVVYYPRNASLDDPRGDYGYGQGQRIANMNHVEP